MIITTGIKLGGATLEGVGLKLFDGSTAALIPNVKDQFGIYNSVLTSNLSVLGFFDPISNSVKYGLTNDHATGNINDVTGKLISAMSAKTYTDNSILASQTTLQENITTVTDIAENNTIAINNEIADRIAADTALQASIDGISGSTALADEITRAIAAETANSDNIALEITDRTNADITLQDGINSNTALINNEAVDRVNADAALQTAIDLLASSSSLADEVIRATNAETAIIDSVTVVDGRVTTEIADRIAGDAALQTQIDNMAAAATNGIHVRDEVLDLSIDAFSQLVAINTAVPIKKYDAFIVTVGGATGLAAPFDNLDAQDLLISKVDGVNGGSGLVNGEWFSIEHNIDDATQVKKGVAKFATPAERNAKIAGVIASPQDVDNLIEDALIAYDANTIKKASKTIAANTLLAGGTVALDWAPVNNTHPIVTFIGNTTGEEYKFTLSGRTTSGCTVGSTINITETLTVTIVG